jgi:hypothetical protein
MTLIDLSRDIYHKMPRLLNHPSVVITPYSTHDEVRVADGYEFSSATMALALGDHAGTHVDAPCHFDARTEARSIDEMPLETFFTEAVCLDLSDKPLKSDISIADLKAAGVAAFPSVPRSARAQSYSARPITMVVPFAAGGPSDVIGRIFAEFPLTRISSRFGTRLVLISVPCSRGHIVLLSLDVGLHVGRWHQPHPVTKGLELARPIMR